MVSYHFGRLKKKKIIIQNMASRLASVYEEDESGGGDSSSIYDGSQSLQALLEKIRFVLYIYILRTKTV